MKISWNWLSKLVDLNGLTPEEVANKLTFAGLEVEGISYSSTATGLICGYVKTCECIPDTHLHVCTVDHGKELGVKQIICGAPNVHADMKVIVATDGAKLPGGEIKKCIIRGYESNGMLCSLSELGVDAKYQTPEDLAGIHPLGEGIEVGDKNVLKYLGLDDVIIDINILANRPDMMAMNNVALEVASLLGRNIIKREHKAHKLAETAFKVGSTSAKCPQFSARIIKGINVKPSPKWMVDTLQSMGVRSISNIVDIGNYVMLLTGQPLHMYDLDKLPKQELIAKDDYEGDFVALDEKHYELHKGDIVITSNNEVMCLGGVMGGLNSSDTESTKNIVIEAANFDYASIRRTSTRLNLVSESSSRFTHGINPYGYNEALETATDLIEELCGASSISKTVTYDTNKHEPFVIQTTASFINGVLGTDFDVKTIADTLSNEGFTTSVDGNNLSTLVPERRIDVSGANDLAEEVIRILGFSHVKNELPTLKARLGSLSEAQKRKRLVRYYLSNNGLHEAMTYVLVNKEATNKFTYLCTEEPYKLINPMTDEHEYVRRGLLGSLLESAVYNLNHQNNDFGLFEISDVDANNYKSKFLSIVLVGSNKVQGELHKTPYTFYSMKGLFEGIMNTLGIDKNRYSLKPWALGGNEMHPGRSASIYQGNKFLGYFGELHPIERETLGLGKTPVVVLEININELINMPTGKNKFTAFSRFPSVSRDLALLVNKEVSSSEVLDVIRRSGKPLVNDAYVFDVYEGENVPEGKKSLAVTLTLINEERTLKDEEINDTVKKVVSELLIHNITVREA